MSKNHKKLHTIEPLMLDTESMKQNDQAKGESKIIFKSETNKDNIANFEEF